MMMNCLSSTMSRKAQSSFPATARLLMASQRRHYAYSSQDLDKMTLEQWGDAFKKGEVFSVPFYLSLFPSYHRLNSHVIDSW